MHNDELVTAKFGEVTVSMPTRVAVRAWLDQIGSVQFGRESACACPHIGDVWPGQGGIYAGMMRGETTLPDYPLIVPTDSRGRIAKISYGGRGQPVAGATSELDGLANMRSLLASGIDHPLAKWATEIEIDGHRDFYPPAIRELALIRANLPELFKDLVVWSSTQHAANSDYAWYQYFGDGSQNYDDKDLELAAVGVRRLILH